MADGETGTTRRVSAKVRWLIWFAFVAVWTVGLLIPSEHTTLLTPEFVISRKFVIAKTVHVLGYAALAVLTGWLHTPLRYRWGLLFFIMFHATLTEVLQLTVSNRTGLLMDVLLDQAAIGGGILLSWKWWTDSST